MDKTLFRKYIMAKLKKNGQVRLKLEITYTLTYFTSYKNLVSLSITPSL